jgi:hypothetical protein
MYQPMLTFRVYFELYDWQRFPFLNKNLTFEIFFKALLAFIYLIDFTATIPFSI